MTRTTQTLPIETGGADIKNWPDSPRALAGTLRRAATPLRKVGIEIDFDQRTPDRRRDRMLELRRVTVEPTVGNADAADAADTMSNQRNGNVIPLPGGGKQGFR